MPRWIAIFDRGDRAFQIFECGDEIGLVEVVSDVDSELIRLTERPHPGFTMSSHIDHNTGWGSRLDLYRKGIEHAF
jgi:hypothetical protein